MRICEWCSSEIGVERKATAKTCSDGCRDQRRMQRARDHATAKYIPRPKALPERDCAHCETSFQPYRESGKFCSRRCQWNSRTVASRPRVRPCIRCGTDTPTRPGKPVCTDCKVDKRDPARAKAREQRRRLNLYGLTQEQYDSMWADQGERCAICRTDTPTTKGWAIDHCHTTGTVRGLLCQPCNLALGQFQDDPAVIRSAARYLETAA